MRILFLFLDGVGLGEANSQSNPFVAVHLPTLTSFTDGQLWVRGLSRLDGRYSSFIPTDACLGVSGKPQSATGQATILTGINIPKVIGYHYGPKPNALIRALIQRHGVVARLVARGLKVGFLTAFPPAFFEAVNSGKRLLSSNQYAMQVGGVALMGAKALFAGHAMSADFTGEGWRTHLGYTDAPFMTPFEAGQRLAQIARNYDLAFFDHWLTDYVGHRGTLSDAMRLLQTLDQVIAGLVESWDPSQELFVMTSDHGNIEDASVRGHTPNPVPTLVFGEGHRAFADGLTDLTHFAPRLYHALTNRH